MGILAKVFLGKLNRYQASGRFLEEPALIAIRCDYGDCGKKMIIVIKVKPTLSLIIKIIMTKRMTLAPMIFKLQNQNDQKKDQPNLSVCRGPFPDMCLYSICRQSSSRTWCIHDYCGVIIIIVMILVGHPEPLMVRS